MEPARQQIVQVECVDQAGKFRHVTWWIAYRWLGPVLLGTPTAFNFRQVGVFYLPDVALLLGLAIFPDVGQALYMGVAAIRVRLLGNLREGTSDERQPTFAHST